MTVRRLSATDAAWIVTVLERRRSGIRHHAPVFWNPAPDAARRHEEFLGGLLASGRAAAYATGGSVLVAARGRAGLVVDDASVVGEDWTGAGRRLWDALAHDHGGEAVRFVCPAYELNRNDFARVQGLHHTSTWWLVELEDATYPPDGTEVEVPGADAALVGAPPVYEPGGPLLTLRAVTDPGAALPAALRRARELRCAGVVVDQAAADAHLREWLLDAGLREQCHYYDGTL